MIYQLFWMAVFIFSLGLALGDQSAGSFLCGLLGFMISYYKLFARRAR
jgi:hypothetical protein